MYMTIEDYGYHEKLFNSLDNSRANDYMDLLMATCSIMTGKEEWVVTVRSAEVIASSDVPQNHIITREMVDKAYLTVTTGPYDEDEKTEFKPPS